MQIVIAALGLLTLLLLPQEGVADGIPVRSGEHADFSRLAIRFPQETRWSVTRTDQGYEIAFRPRARLDLSTVFDLIPRDRIEDVLQNPATGSLVIDTSCDCELDVFEAGSRTVAIDVADRAQGSVRDLANNVLPPGLLFGAIPNRARSFPGQTVPKEVFDASSDGTGMEGTPEPVPYDPRVDARTRPERDASAPQVPDRPVGDILAEALQDDLTRAADAGLIDLIETEDKNAADRSSHAGSIRQDPSMALRSSHLNLRMGNDVLPLEGATVDPTEEACNDSDLFQFMFGVPSKDSMSRLPQLRERLVDDRGEPSRAGARDLLKAYLALGFGAEAMLIVPRAEFPNRQEALFASMARIADAKSDTADDLWTGLQICDSSVALWALLGQSPGLPAVSVNAPAIQQAFFSLPDYMRLYLGAPVADRLEQAGHIDAATAIRNNSETLRRGASDPADAPGGEVASAADTSMPILQPTATDTRMRDLLDNLEHSLRVGRAVSPDDVATATALAAEYDGTPSGARLRDALIVGHLQSGDLELAIAALSNRVPAATRQWEDAFRDAVSANLANQSDAGILRIVLHPQRSRLADLISDRDAFSMADKLSVAGFPDAASSLIEGRQVDGVPEADLTVARVALGSGDPRRALALLAGREDPQAARVRAQAHERLGSYALAAQAHAATGQGAEAARSAWLSGNSEAIFTYGSELQKSAQEQLIELQDGYRERLSEVTGPGTFERPVGPDPANGRPERRQGSATQPQIPGGPTDPATSDGAEPPAIVDAPFMPLSLATARAALERSGQLREALATLEQIGAGDF